MQRSCNTPSIRGSDLKSLLSKYILHITSVRRSSTSTLPLPTHLYPLPLSPLTSQHTSLPTFLTHATTTSLSPTSTTYIGTHYEYTTLSSLRRLGLDLVRTGGRADKGIDLLGHWYLPGLPTGWPLRVLVQCKALRRKVSPNVVREMEGLGTGARGVRWRDRESETGRDEASLSQEGKEDANSIRPANRNIIILLATPQEATKGVREAMAQSRWPMAYLKISLDGRVEQLLWNRTAAAIGTEGVNVVTRHVPREVKRNAIVKIAEVTLTGEEFAEKEVTEDTGLEKPDVMDREVVVTWKGEAWEWPLESAYHGENESGPTVER